MKMTYEPEMPVNKIPSELTKHAPGNENNYSTIRDVVVIRCPQKNSIERRARDLSTN
jgi:hypothetical protein